jgi:hypothetical protein
MASSQTPLVSDNKSTAQDPSVNGESSMQNGYRKTKMPDPDLMNVERPKQQDLQPTYAMIVASDDHESHGWYGSMSKFNARVMLSIGRNEARTTTDNLL